MAENKQRPKGNSYYNKRAETYEKRRRKQPWWQVEQDQMAELLAGLPDGLSVVDIPFGTGRFVADYLGKDFKVSGLDASDHMLAAAKDALGDDYERCTCVVGDAADLPYEDGQFDLLVSTRFLRDIVTFAQAKNMLAEFARVTNRFAILQLGHSFPKLGYPDDDDVMAGRMTEAQVIALLAKHGLDAKEWRLVKDDGEGKISHILCEKTAA